MSLSSFFESVIAPYEFFHSEILLLYLELDTKDPYFQMICLFESIQMRDETLANTIF